MFILNSVLFLVPCSLFVVVVPVPVLIAELSTNICVCLLSRSEQHICHATVLVT